MYVIRLVKYCQNICYTSIQLLDPYPVQYLGYCTVCNHFNLSSYFNLMDINMSHHRATSSIRVTPLSPISLLFSQHPSASSNFKKLSLCFSLPSDLSLGLHGYSQQPLSSAPPILVVVPVNFLFLSNRYFGNFFFFFKWLGDLVVWIFII